MTLEVAPLVLCCPVLLARHVRCIYPTKIVTMIVEIIVEIRKKLLYQFTLNSSQLNFRCSLWCKLFSFPTDSSPSQDLDEEIQKLTTMAYRSPEMVDLFLNYPIGEPLDVWVGGRLYDVLNQMFFLDSPRFHFCHQPAKRHLHSIFYHHRPLGVCCLRCVTSRLPLVIPE